MATLEDVHTRFRRSTMTRLVHMLTPSPTDEDVRRCSALFATNEQTTREVEDLRRRSVQMWRELRERRALAVPLVETRFSLMHAVAAVAVGLVLGILLARARGL